MRGKMILFQLSKIMLQIFSWASVRSKQLRLKYKLRCDLYIHRKLIL